MLSITSDMKEKQGLSASKLYEAYVIENDDRKHPDKMMLGRIQARVAVLFDGIEDKDLPWAVPFYAHPDGASEISGTFSIPKKRTKVFLRFQDANPAFPMYEGYHVDKVTQMEEIKYNYPNRTVTRFSNKAMMVVDTQDNTVYLRNPGNCKIYIEGNVELEIKGNVDELIRGSVRRTIMGNFHDTVYGRREILTGLAKVETTLGLVHEYSSGCKTVESSGGECHMEGTNIYMNSSKALGAPTPPINAKMSKWPGIPGGAQGTNKRPKPEAKDATKPNQDSPPTDAIATPTPDIESHMPLPTNVKPCVGTNTPTPPLTPQTGASTQLPEHEDIPSHFGSTDNGGGDRNPGMNSIPKIPMN